MVVLSARTSSFGPHKQIGDFLSPVGFTPGAGLAVVTAPVLSTERMIPMNSSAELSDTQIALLSAASRREDHCLIAAKTLKGGALTKVAAKVLDAGLVRELKARAGMAIWRRDEGGQALSLKLTAAGLKAVRASSESAVAAKRSPRSTKDPSKSKKAVEGAKKSNATTSPFSSAPREGTKLAHVIALLQRDEGAKLAQLIAATGWLPHTARAALTGLRHRGYEVRLERGEKGRASVYRTSVAIAVAS